eukprot:7669412-Pyramimonas_sp.AAC.1
MRLSGQAAGSEMPEPPPPSYGLPDAGILPNSPSAPPPPTWNGTEWKPASGSARELPGGGLSPLTC